MLSAGQVGGVDDDDLPGGARGRIVAPGDRTRRVATRPTPLSRHDGPVPAADDAPTGVPRAATAGAAPVRPRDDSAARALLDAAAVALDVLPLDAALATAFATGPLGGLDTLAMRRLRLALRREELDVEDAQGLVRDRTVPASTDPQP